MRREADVIIALSAILLSWQSHSQEVSPAVLERSKEAPTGWFGGAGAGFAHVRWKTTPKVHANGLSFDLKGGYLHGFRSGLVLGGEVCCCFFPDLAHAMGNNGQIELGKVSASISGLLGTFLPQIKGILGTAFGFSSVNTKIERTENGKKREEKFSNFQPEIGLFYMTNIWKTVYIRVDGRCAVGLTSSQIETNRFMIMLSMFYLF
ncbi:MAG: hypothetical protein LBD15_02750 [Holosporales bacterium]|jgi:hypothetical protein|nr:hypothetical protein [Holosporales bacterium]